MLYDRRFILVIIQETGFEAVRKMDRFRGINGTILLGESSLEILREGSLDRTFHNIKRLEIPYSSIEGIKVVPGSLINGYISVIRSGERGPRGLASAIRDEHSVMFRMFKNTQAERFAGKIRAKL